MHLLIDGYNLLHASGIFGRGKGPGGFERSRVALLNFVAESMDEGERSTVTVVFDAAGAPPGLPSSMTHRDVHVRFAKGYASADDLLEELIRADSVPRKLTVVSSDHRIQRAAHRRRATAVDSDVWFQDAQRRRAQRNLKPRSKDAPPGAVTADEVEYWLRQFEEKPDEEKLEGARGADDIFPPGYGEDVGEE
jgi:predicted RNA-binding protein with PIN domain